MKSVGVLLINLGTPDSPRPADVRRYLREFLGDPRVIDLPAPARWLLLEAVILPFRPRRSAAAYREIWTGAGSPLLVHGRALCEAVAKELGAGFRVELAMRYGRPSVPHAIDALVGGGVDAIVVLPLFPQYASSSTGSALEHVYRAAARQEKVPPLQVVPPFHSDPGFIRAAAAAARQDLGAFSPDHVLLSFHGLPERQVRAGGSSCLEAQDCCETLGPANWACYRAQCFATSRALTAELGLEPARVSLAFQSRLGRAAWIGPSVEDEFARLAAAGKRRLAVLCPSFVADCLETLEEIGIRARETWRGLGGEELRLLPCVNAHPEWVRAAAALIRARAEN